jgi:hypothetical protein
MAGLGPAIAPVFRKDHAQTKKLKRDGDSIML